jgi:hypothetical protein
MHARFLIGLTFVLACSSHREDVAGSASGSAVPPHDTTAAIRWMWVTSAGGPFLTYYYVDRMAGPSSKGAHVDDPPTASQLDAVLRAPTRTFRDPIRMGAHTATAAEVASLKLPDRPAWLDIYEPPGSAPPVVPTTAQTGRPLRTPGTAYAVQIACGPNAGSVVMIGAAETHDIGANKYDPVTKPIVLRGDGVLAKHATLTNSDALTLTPVADAKVLVNGQPITAPLKLAIGDRINIGRSTLIIRAESFEPVAGVDASCPGFKEQVWIEDGCSMYGVGYMQLLGGDEMTIGTDVPTRELRDYHPAFQVHVKLFNRNGTIEFTALDPQHPPKVKGVATAKGTLAVGGVIAVGDRLFAIVKDEEGTPPIDPPAASCPEARAKAAKGK